MIGQIRFAKPGLGTVILASAMLSLFTWTGEARAIPLCENRPSPRVCRVELEERVNLALQSLQDGLRDPDEARNAIQGYETALESFSEARDIIDGPGSVSTRCSNASAEDERAIKNAARGVRDSFELVRSQFRSNAAFNAARTRLTNLTLDMIDAVENNINELVFLTGNPNNNDVETARQRVQKARSNFAAGKLVTAADSAQSAYDIVEDNNNGNMGGCLTFQ